MEFFWDEQRISRQQRGTGIVFWISGEKYSQRKLKPESELYQVLQIFPMPLVWYDHMYREFLLIPIK